MAGGIQVAGGDLAYHPSIKTKTAIPEQPKTSSGGPIETPAGLDSGKKISNPVDPAINRDTTMPKPREGMKKIEGPDKTGPVVKKP